MVWRREPSKGAYGEPWSGYVVYCRWYEACQEHPHLRAAVWQSHGATDHQLVVYSEYGPVWFFPVPHPVHWLPTGVEVYQLVSKYIRKAVQMASGAKGAAEARADEWAIAHEAIWEYMTTDTVEGGGERQTSTLFIFVENGMVKVALQDRQEGLSLWATAQSVSEALEALEGRLRAGDGDWRPSRTAQQQRGKRK